MISQVYKFLYPPKSHSGEEESSPKLSNIAYPSNVVSNHVHKTPYSSLNCFHPMMKHKIITQRLRCIKYQPQVLEKGSNIGRAL